MPPAHRSQHGRHPFDMMEEEAVELLTPRPGNGVVSREFCLCHCVQCIAGKANPIYFAELGNFV